MRRKIPFVALVGCLLLVAPAAPVHAATGDITEFPQPAGLWAWNIAAGPDGNMWFTGNTNDFDDNVGMITPSGDITWFPGPYKAGAVGIAAGPDGNMWFAETNGYIGRITPSGDITEFLVGHSAYNFDITAGPDGNMWFTEHYGSAIGRITPSGTITEFPLPQYSMPMGITTGSDGNMWFTERYTGWIGRITPSGVITEFPTPYHVYGPELSEIAAGPDGNIWFTEGFTQWGPNMIARITPSGVITEFPVPTVNAGLGSITAGPDGNVWFTEGNGYMIARITPSGVITEFTVPKSPGAITTGPDGALWFTEAGSWIGRFDVSPAYKFVGFTSPVDNLPAFNLAKAGQAIPLKWRLLGANDEPVTNLVSVKVTVAGLSCLSGATLDQVEEYASGSSGLQNLGDGYYQFNWKTATSYAKSCRTMKLDLGGGFVQTAEFWFK